MEGLTPESACGGTPDTYNDLMPQSPKFKVISLSYEYP